MATKFEENFYFDEPNRMVGSGGEILVKGDGSASPRIQEGDRLIGIGVTHLVESLARTPGTDSFRAITLGNEHKAALRAFEVAKKTQTANGFDFAFRALTPQAYVDLVASVSDGAVRIARDSIPEGTVIMSFLDESSSYTLQTVKGSPGENWRWATKGQRHWNVGIAKDTDFWWAQFPSDDVSLLTQMPPAARVGRIRFGLSLLPGSRGWTQLTPVSCLSPSGQTTEHQFCLEGTAAGTGGLDTPFPIGLRTEITFNPVR